MSAPEPIPYAAPGQQWLIDTGHLRMLSICHYVWGGLVMALSLIFLIHVGIGIGMLTGAMPMNNSGSAGPPRWFGWFFVAMGSGLIALGWSIGILTILSGRWMMRRRRRVFSLVIAGINCASFPFGTLLGVFTFIVLLRPSVRAMYEGLA